MLVFLKMRIISLYSPLCMYAALVMSHVLGNQRDLKGLHQDDCRITAGLEVCLPGTCGKIYLGLQSCMAHAYHKFEQ